MLVGVVKLIYFQCLGNSNLRHKFELVRGERSLTREPESYLGEVLNFKSNCVASKEGKCTVLKHNHF
jgi:hypothetical protein